MWQAASEGDILSLRSFLESGLRVDGRDAEARTPLMYAAYEGRNDAIEVLINNGADVNAADFYWVTPLMAAAQNGHVNAVELLLRRGVEVNRKSDFVPGRVMTALSIAKEKGYGAVVEVLEGAGGV